MQRTDLKNSIFYAEGDVVITNKNKEFIAKSKKKLPKALIVIHLAGLPADPVEIKKLAQKYKFFISLLYQLKTDR